MLLIKACRASCINMMAIANNVTQIHIATAICIIMIIAMASDIAICIRG